MDYPTVTCRVLRRFWWRPEIWKKGKPIPLGETRQVEPGETLEGVMHVAATGWAQRGLVEIVGK